jgi:hypothetical protein
MNKNSQAILEKVSLVVVATRTVSPLRDTHEGGQVGSRISKVLQSCFDPTALRPFGRMKQESRRLCSSFGTRIESLGAFAVPLESTDRLLEELGRIDIEWQERRNELADAIEFQVKDWAMKNPAERDAILALAPSRDDVIESTRFFFTSFRLHASDVEDNGGLEQDLTGLAGQALYEFSVALRDASVHKIVGTDFTKGVFEVLSRLARKAESLAFLGPSIAEVASVLTSTVAMLPADGTLNAAHAIMVRSIIDQMLEPRKLAASGFLSLRANMNAAAVNAIAPTQAPVREAVEPSRAAAFAW